MSVELKELQEKKNTIGARLEELGKLANDPNHEWRSEDEENWLEVNKDYDAVRNRLEKAIKLNELEEERKALERPKDSKVSRAIEARGGSAQGREYGAMSAKKPRWLETHEERQARVERGDMSSSEFSAALIQGMLISKNSRHDLLRKEHHHAFKHFGLHHTADQHEFRLFDGNYHLYRAMLLAERINPEVRQMGLTPTAGAEWTDELWERTLEKTMLYFGPMWQVCDVRTTISGSNYHWPTTDDTSNEAVIVGQNTLVGDQDVATAELVLGAFKYTSLFIKVAEELMEDSIFNMAQVLAEIIGERLGRGTNRDFTVGDGASKPTGVITGSTSVLTATVGTMVAADWMDLEHGVDKAYRSGARFMMHDSIVLAVRKLENAQGDFIYQQGLQLGQPDQLLGYPLEVNNHMSPTIAAGEYIGEFGDFRQFKIRRVRGVRLHTLTERFRDLDQTGFVGFLRTDGAILQPAAFRRLEVRTT